MKKLLLSLFVIFTFGFYVIYYGQSAPIVAIDTNTLISPTTTTGTENTKKNTVPTTKTPTPTSTTKPTPAPTPVAIAPKGKYKDGTYTGNVADAYYGNLQVQAVISGGKLVGINILDYPQDRSTSRAINAEALPILKQEAIKAQSAKIDILSGASATSPAFIQSLGSALALAKI